MTLYVSNKYMELGLGKGLSTTQHYDDEFDWNDLNVKPAGEPELDDDYVEIVIPELFGKQIATVQSHFVSQDVTLVILLHIALFWFLANNWQAPNKVEQLKQLQQQLPNKISAFLYYAPQKVNQQKTTSVEAQTEQYETKVEPKPKETKLKEKAADKPQSDVNQAQQKPFNFKAATQSYLQRNQLKRLDDFQSENEQYRYGSTSEMTPQMKQEWLPAAEGFDKKLTLDHQLDPNRVYRFGATCYRVVKIIDPIAGDSENLGYKFKCGQTDQEKALAASLEKYTKKKR